ncbi:MAG TPA: hypothetical protein VF810_03025, partial [Patescibacteria group bacterium]
LLTLTVGNETISPPSYIPTGGLSNLQVMLSNFLTLFIVVGVFFLVIYITIAGIQWITAGGDKQKLSAARGRLTWAIIGLVIILSSFFIINIVGYLFKVNLLKII